MTDQANEQSKNSYQFQAEVARLLDLMVHSVYSERQIFLRELISNSADALDKLRYEALTDENLIKDDTELAITIIADKDANTLTLIDNGIGMTKQEMVENLGTIARSGTKAFIDEIKQNDDKKTGPDLIGQFGVGFYSSFMVADRVDVISRRAGSDESWQWSSDGKGAFDINTVEEEQPTGTRITLHIKDDAAEFLEENEIRRIVHTYSDHISFPIFLKGTEPAKDDSEEKQSEPEDALQQLNTANALWTRSKDEITDEQYKEFYHHTGNMFDDPAITIHYTAEGRQLFTSLLFIPSSPPFDLYDAERSGKIKLYVKRIFITDDAEILPSYLRFVRGIVDSEDIPLNLSREMLQNNPLLTSIRKAVANRILSELKKSAASDPEKYLQIWKNFGAVIKEGLYEDMERRDTLYELVRFRSTLNALASKIESDTPEAESWRSLKEYVADMPEKQDAIYYLAGDNMEQLKASPQLEGYVARNLEVLLLADPVDSFWVTTAAGFEGKPFHSITQGDATLDDIPVAEDKKSDDSDVETNQALLERLKTALADEVMDVKKSSRLVDSPACLIAASQSPDRQLEKMLAAQKGGDMPAAKPILEVNASHDLAKALNSAIIDKKDERFADLAFLLLDQARILEGNAPADPAEFTKRLNRLLLG